jgi:hypothetical protein
MKKFTIIRITYCSRCKKDCTSKKDPEWADVYGLADGTSVCYDCVKVGEQMTVEPGDTKLWYVSAEGLAKVKQKVKESEKN